MRVWDTEPARLALIKGNEVDYDACSNDRDADYSPDVYKYIGQGRISRIGASPSTSTEELHFWILKKKI